MAKVNKELLEDLLARLIINLAKKKTEEGKVANKDKEFLKNKIIEMNTSISIFKKRQKSCGLI